METFEGERFWDWVHRFLEDPGYETRLSTPALLIRAKAPEAVLPATARAAQEIVEHGNVERAPRFPRSGSSQHGSRNQTHSDD
jgi:hypothetical protein